MDQIQGVNIAAPVVPYTTGDVYPTHLARWGKGGYRTVADITERDSIMPQRLEMYMIVCTESDGKMYRLVSLSLPLGPQNWEEIKQEISYYEYTFENQSVMEISHNQNRFVNVKVLSSQGNPVEADIQQTDKNNLTVRLSEPISGTIIIS
jgi:hypothetical protein